MLTRVLDTSLGRPAAGVPVRLEHAAGGEPIAGASTDDDVRVRELGQAGLRPGTYRAAFDTRDHFARSGQRSFYPQVPVTFAIDRADGHYHVPLVLSPFAYSTYRVQVAPHPGLARGMGHVWPGPR